MNDDNQGRVYVARVDLGVRWRWHPSALRGAVLASVARVSGGDAGLHSDWNGRLQAGEGETLSRIAPICYRVDGDRAGLYLWGPRTGERLAELGRIDSVTDPDGRVQVVAVAVDGQEESVGLMGRHWYLYESAMPWWPPGAAWQRYPGRDAPREVLRAWAGLAVASGLHGALRGFGVEVAGPTRVSVQVEQVVACPVVWHRDTREIHHNAVGFRLRWISNVRLPDGFALGKHTSEGYGEMRREDDWKLPN